MSKAAIERARRIGWNTVDRWLEKAPACCRRFNQERIRDLEIQELPADGIRTIVGRRNYRHTRSLLRDIRVRSQWDHCPLIVTEGLEFYERAARGVFGTTCLYGRVIKTRRNDRVILVERELILITDSVGATDEECSVWLHPEVR